MLHQKVFMHIFVWKIEKLLNLCFLFSACFVFGYYLITLSNNLSNNTVIFYTYICYWNTFQYKYINYTNYFSCCKIISHVSDFKSKDVFTLILFLCLYIYFRFISLFYLRKLSSSFSVYLTWDPQSTCLGFTNFNVPPCLLPETINNQLV